MSLKISSLALKYEVEILQTYASQLDESINAFDISRLELLLQEFNKIESKLSF